MQRTTATQTAVCCIVQIDPVTSQVHGDQLSIKARAEPNEIHNKGQADSQATSESTYNHWLSPSVLLRLRLVRPSCIKQFTPQGGTSMLGGRGTWPQNLPLKFLLNCRFRYIIFFSKLNTRVKSSPKFKTR